MNNIPDMTNKADVRDHAVGVNYFHYVPGRALFAYDKLYMMINNNQFV